MAWFYLRGKEQVGPIDDGAFHEMIQRGEIAPDTYVWHQGLANWQRLSEVEHLMSHQPAGADSLGDMAACAECNSLENTEDMVRYQNAWICAKCKEVYFQRLREGAALPGRHVYAGFWIRFGAKLIDGVIMWVMSLGLTSLLSPVMVNPEWWLTPGWLLMNVLTTAMGITYVTVFVGRLGATPGKLACGLRIVRPDGGRVTYLRAFGRYFADILSALFFCIGYLMVAFDKVERRALHDHMCDTRVIRVNRG